ncbi:hypothetical protein PENTCL1PPCAC_4156, partial [Pristionchus entomophagus]
DELLSVNVVIRHADRSATSGWATPQSPQILFRGSGELTDLLVPLLTCEDGWEDVISRFNLSSNVDVQKTALVAMMMTQWPAACSTVNPALIDAIVSELPNKKINMPANYKSCAEGPAKEFMYKYIELLAGAGDHYNEVRIKRVAGLLTTELLANFAADVNILALSHIFGILDRFNVSAVTSTVIPLLFIPINRYQGVTPAFSSALVFETRRNANGAYVKASFSRWH